jgi:hypothetical protein
MPTYNTSLYNALVTPRAAGARALAANTATGTINTAHCSYTLLGTETAGTIINLAILPAGTTPVPGLSKVTVSGSTSPGTLALNVGTATDDDGWAAAISLTNGGAVFCDAGTAPAVWANTSTPLAPDANSGNAAVFATLTSAASLVAGRVLSFTLAYKVGAGV